MDSPTVTWASVWHLGYDVGSVFVNMAGRKKNKLESLHLAPRQYFSRVGVLTQQAGSLKFAEIKFDPADTALTDFLTSGIRLNDNSTLLPHQALEIQIKVICLGPFNLPFLNDKALLAELKEFKTP